MPLKARVEQLFVSGEGGGGGGDLCSYVTGGKTNLHGTLTVTEDLELRQGDLVADPDAVRALVPLVPDVPHRVSD